MDKSVITRVVTVAGGRFAPGHLGELTQQVPFEMVDAVLEQTYRVQRRVRDLPAWYSHEPSFLLPENGHWPSASPDPRIRDRTSPGRGHRQGTADAR